MVRKLLCCFLILTFTALAGVAWGAEDAESVETEAVYTGEFYRNAAGGVRVDSAYLDNIDLTLTADLEQSLGWSGATFFLYLVANSGDDPTELTGDVQGTSNIETGVDTTKVYELWIEQRLGSGRVSALFGLYDLNSEFDAIETAGVFLNSSHGIGPDFSQSGTNGPSIFPTTSLGVRLKGETDGGSYVQAAVLDGVPGDPDDPYGTHVKLDAKDGYLVVLETALVRGGNTDGKAGRRRYALGTWYYTQDDADDLNDVDSDGNPVTHNNTGVYLFTDIGLSRDTSAFLRYGIADPKVNAIGSYLGFGVAVDQPFTGDEGEALGFAVAMAFAGADYEKARKAAGDKIDAAETNLELTYQVPLTDWLVLHPDLQYVIDPGMDPALDNALVASLRFEIAF